MSGPVSPLVLERYELKYLIPFSMVAPISRYVERFCTLDYYSQISPDQFYTINSLYFESPSYYFMRAKENATARYSLRVRSYGDSPKPPYFLETKEKIADFSKKRRGKVPLENWGDLFTNRSKLEGVYDYTQDPHVMHFLHLTELHNASPIILTQYRRKAYLSEIDDYARVTFDRSLRYRPETNYDVHPTWGMTSYDHPDTFGYEGANVILELKCERKIPMWLVELIKHFQLVRMGFSKFEGSMIECYRPHIAEEFQFDRIKAY